MQSCDHCSRWAEQYAACVYLGVAEDCAILRHEPSLKMKSFLDINLVTHIAANFLFRGDMEADSGIPVP